MSQQVVLDASALVDVVARRPHGAWVLDQIADHSVAAPAHLRSEAFSGLGRRFRAGAFTADQTEEALRLLTRMRIIEHPVSALLLSAWARRDQLRLADALYVELAAQLDTVVVTTDRRLARATSLALAPPE